MFDNRLAAGALLGKKLLASSVGADIVLGLARGGVAVAKTVAKTLEKPFDVLVVRKIGSPGNPELALGARVPEGQPVNVQGKRVILVDDGAATGASMYEAIRWARQHDAAHIIAALPIAPPDVVHALQALADNVVVLETPDDFQAVGAYYKDFSQMTDKDVVQLLA